MTSRIHLSRAPRRRRVPWLAFALLLVAGCGRVVGAECIDGYDLCGEVCCPTGMCSADGVCVATDAGPIVDGDVSDGEVRDADVQDGAVPDGDVDADMGPPGCPIGTSQCDGECVNLDVNPDNCGACGDACAAGEFCRFGVCVETCDPPLIECDGRCVDPNSDPDNCNGCGNVCDSAICRPEGCSESGASDVILIGHDYQQSLRAADLLVANGALLRLEEPVRIVVYEGTVSNPSRNAIRSAIDSIATEAGRSTQFVPSDASLVPTRLERADTFLVMPQQGSTTDEALRSLGRQWARALADFLARGGAIVVLEGGEGHAGTWQIPAAAGLLTVESRVGVVTGSTLTNDEPTDAIANEVPLSYAAPRRTYAFTGVADGEVVNADVDGETLPVAVHRFLAAP